MIQTLNTVLFLWGRALSARTLYPGGHRSVESLDEEAAALFLPALKGEQEISIVAIEKRVVWNHETLPCGEAIAGTLLRALQMHRIDRVTFKSGFTEAEMKRFLDCLAAALRQEGKPEESEHLQFGFLLASDTFTDPNAAVELVRGLLVEASESGRVDLTRVNQTVGGILELVANESSVLIPLAELKSHDDYTFVHTVNVALLSAATARAMGYRKALVHDIAIGAILHDIGKQRVPLPVLNKLGTLSAEDVRIIREHPVHGARILFGTPGMPDLAPIVAFEHHIRNDGTGYPDAPSDWKPNVASRIVQLADVFDALRTNRPYRDAIPPVRLMEIMRGDADTCFDRSLLEFFLREVAMPSAEPVLAG